MLCKLKVEGQTLRWYGEPEVLAADSVDFVGFEFILPEDWDGYTLHATFQQADKAYTQVLEDRKCTLPPEIVVGNCGIGLFGYQPGKSPRATTNLLNVQVCQSGFVPDGEYPVPPTPDLYSQLLSQLDSKVDEAEQFAVSAVQAAQQAQSHANQVKSEADLVVKLSDDVAKKATQASDDSTAAAQAKEAAETAKRLAETARDAAETAQKAAETAQSAAAQSATNADAAKQAAEAALKSAQNAAGEAANALSDLRELYQQMQTWAAGVVQDINAEGSNAIQSVQAAATAGVASVNAAGDAQVQRVEYEATHAGDIQVERVKSEGSKYAQMAVDAAKVAQDKAAEIAGKSDQIEANTVGLNELKQDLDNLTSVTEDILITSNIFDYESVTDGYYVPYTSGIPVANARFCYSDYMYIKGASKATISKKYGFGIGSVHCAFYDVNKKYISGAIAGTDAPTIDIPNDASYLIISISVSEKHNYKVEIGENATQFSYFAKLIVPKAQKEIDYNLKSANDFVKELYTVGELASDNHRVNFHIPNGEYDIKTLIANHSYIGDFTKGLYVPDYVTIIGNSKENTILKYVCDSSNVNISTLNFKGTSGIKDLTVYGEKTRYAIHDDTNPNYEPYYRNVKDCIIEGVDCYYGSSYGSGSYSGAVWKFENVDFVGPFSWHSNYNFTMPNDITLKNCTVIADNSRNAVLKSLGSGVLNRIHLIGCSIPSIACITESGVSTIDFMIDGYGNNEIPVESTVAGFMSFFHDCVSVLKANSDLVKGNTVTKSAHLCPKFNGASKLKKLFGIAIEDIPNGSFGHIQYRGYILASEIGLESANDGDYVGISNAMPIVVTDETQAIGMIEVMWTTKFLHLF